MVSCSKDHHHFIIFLNNFYALILDALMLAFYHDLYLKSKPSAYMIDFRKSGDANTVLFSNEKLSGEMHLLPCSFVQGVHYGLQRCTSNDFLD